MRVEVTAGDIAAGKADDCTECPVALALNRATRKAWWVEYDAAFQRWTPSRRLKPMLRLTSLVSEWIQAYDRGEAVAPFAFELPDAGEG
jgi:hypothetical protein